MVDFGRPTFSWEELSWADWYELVVEPAGGGAAVVTVWLEGSTACDLSTCSWPASITLASGEYQWKVRGYTPAYAVGVYATPNALTMQTAPQLNSPGDGATVTVSQPTLSWAALSWVTHYNVQIIPVGGGTTIDRWVDHSVVCSGGVCTWQVNATLADGDYTWQVRGFNSGTLPTTSPWSNAWDLTVDVP